MSGKYSPAAQQKLAAYENFVNDVGRINSLVEQFAVAKVGHEGIRASIKRAAGMAKLKFMTSGMAQLSQLCGVIELQASRGGPPSTATRAFREQVGQLKFQIELEMRLIIKEDEELQHTKKIAKEAAAKEASRQAAEAKASEAKQP